MEIAVRQKGRVVILDIRGCIDINSAKLVEAIGYFVHKGLNDILCNFERVQRIDYVGISTIAVAYKEVANHGGRMTLENVPAHLREIFAITGLEVILEIYATEDAALNSFKEDKIIQNIQKQKLRRRFKRIPLDLKVKYRSKNSPAAKFIEGEVLDLSGLGAFIFGKNKFVLGELIDLRLRLTPEENELKIDAKVVWLPDKQIQPHHHPGLGIEFYDISDVTQKEIIAFIDKNLSRLS